MALLVFRAGLLACLRPSRAAFPCAGTVAWCGVVRLTAAGAAPECLVAQCHRLPVSPASRKRGKAPETSPVYDEVPWAWIVSGCHGWHRQDAWSNLDAGVCACPRGGDRFGNKHREPCWQFSL